MSTQAITFLNHKKSAPIKRALYILSVVLCAYLCPSVIHAIDTLSVKPSDPFLESWRWTEFSEHKNFLGNIFHGYEDRDGHMWFGASTGLHQYDGYHWTHHPLPDNLLKGNITGVRNITQDQKGNIWAAIPEQGIGRFDGKSWMLFTPKDGIANISPRCLITTKNGDIYAGHDSGLSRFDGTKLDSDQNPNRISGTCPCDRY